MQIYINLLLTLSLAVCFSNDLSQVISKQFPTQIQSNINNNGDIPSDLLDLFYLKLITDSFYNNNKEYKYEGKVNIWVNKKNLAIFPKDKDQLNAINILKSRPGYCIVSRSKLYTF